ncbi:adenylosuccinate lyase [Actinomycetaceae bacterium WB03_NA08]|uniref:Adenylosuccinate lyase n=1 Tax=Scrofimicrobium canadense TaxID=2652290 RepID=A0A6N7W412_9ACTO|nr:adenylosuccinate lyase [Scrofimicrobium canadense]MSS83192.1 adenylosuccinate lyase [Scrofimicrobium canadense]
MTPAFPSQLIANEALSPLDGRYRSQTAPLTAYLSEAALNRARLFVEVEWLIYSIEQGIYPGLQPLDSPHATYLRELPQNFSEQTRQRLAQFEKETRHDVKAVEYLLREHLSQVRPDLLELVHVFCTSEDINNLSYALCVKAAVEKVWRPAAEGLVGRLKTMAAEYAQVPMLSRTHGQTATPTTLGKEMAVFAHRLGRQLGALDRIEYLGKFNGATGTFSAHVVALPHVDWPQLSRGFVEHLGLTWNPLTTQIESHDWMAELFSVITHFNRIAHNLATDAWTYISLGYFRQMLSAQGSTGSSTMPHKINPIRFENAEANLEISSALLDALCATLVTSRLQRDLTDSTTQRNIGSALGYSLLALDNICAGLDGVAADTEVIAADLASRWEVLSEAIQQVLRVETAIGQANVDSPYEKLKALTRGKGFSEESLREFVESLGLQPATQERLLQLRPETYIGVAPRLTEEFLD